jgi:hypothetical protein
LALGYGGKEFSTQDIIDRLGIVDIDQVQQTVTPLRRYGLLERSKTHAQAYKYAEQHRIPKRAVPTYRVIDPATRKQGPPPDDVEVIIEEPARIHKIYISNLPYHLTSHELVSWLTPVCDVRGLQIPRSAQQRSSNRGYAFATVAYPGEINELLAMLDGWSTNGRRVHVAPHRELGDV